MVGAALEDKDSYVCIIADGYHVHPATFGITVAAKQAGRTVLVTDAMPTVGSDIKSFDLFGVTIRAEGGRCVTADGTLAGSDIGLITAVKNACRFASTDRFEALRMASAYAADADWPGRSIGDTSGPAIEQTSLSSTLQCRFAEAGSMVTCSSTQGRGRWTSSFLQNSNAVAAEGAKRIRLLLNEKPCLRCSVWRPGAHRFRCTDNLRPTAGEGAYHLPK